MTKTLGRVGIGIVFLVGCSSSGSKSMGTGGTSGGGTGGMGGAGGSAVTIGNFAQRYAEALCTKNFTCCSGSDLTDHTMSQCLMDNAGVISVLTAQIDASQAQGRATYDVAASASCIDALNAMTCDEFKQGIDANADACMSFVVAKVAMGGACAQGYECTTNNCVGASTDPAVDGTCAAAPTLAAIGTSCAASDCVDGAYCDSASICRKKKAGGEACTLADECVNSCNTATGLCSCYAGCAVVDAVSTGGTVLSMLLLSAGVVFACRRRRQRA
ncbi:MAG TPA: hypothetical protein VIQ54_05445 [Polyangia bacterium]|jgi:hypothetical protein